MFFKFPILQFLVLLFFLSFLCFRYKNLYSSSQLLKQRTAIKKYYVANDEQAQYERKYGFIPDSLPSQKSLTFIRDSIGEGRGTHHSFIQTSIVPVVLFNKFKVNGLVPSTKLNDTILAYFPDTKTWQDPRNPLFPVKDSIIVLKSFGNNIFILYKKNL